MGGEVGLPKQSAAINDKLGQQCQRQRKLSHAHCARGARGRGVVGEGGGGWACRGSVCRRQLLCNRFLPLTKRTISNNVRNVCEADAFFIHTQGE